MDTNLIYCGDCKNVMGSHEFRLESVDLIYLDPPFFTNKKREIIWGDRQEKRAFEDRWRGGINHYTSVMEPILEVCRDALKMTGTLWLHCDYHANHHLRLALDRVFGPERFVNEVIWCYSGGGVPKKALARKHDNLYVYARGEDHVYNPQYVPYSEASQQLVRSRGGTSIDGKSRDLERGAHMPDWWTDINSLQTWSPERIGYPTQKPVKLLKRIISISSDEGHLVVDPFCGCGTAIVAAHELGREWIGIDISPTACKVMKERMEGLEGIAEVEVRGLPATAKDLMGLDPFKFQDYVCRRLGGRASERKSGDMGIDGYVSRDNTPIQVKQSRAGRNVIDNFYAAIRRKRKKEGIIVAESFTKTIIEEADRLRREAGTDIRLVTVEELLGM